MRHKDKRMTQLVKDNRSAIRYNFINRIPDGMRGAGSSLRAEGLKAESGIINIELMGKFADN